MLLGAPLARAPGVGVRSLVALAAAVAAFGLMLEAAQHWVPGRMASPLDMVANTAGVALGLGIVLMLRAKRRFVRDSMQPAHDGRADVTTRQKLQS